MKLLPSFTLEWNAVLALEDEEYRIGKDAIKRLISLHGNKIDLGIVTTAASENNRDREFSPTAHDFQSRLDGVGLGSVTKVKTAIIVGLTYVGYGFYPEKDFEEIVGAIWDIVRPEGIPRRHSDFAVEKGIEENTSLHSPNYFKWRNKWCDVHSLYAHLVSKRDVFVTGDVKNFSGDRKTRLGQLGISNILSYDDALELALSI